MLLDISLHFYASSVRKMFFIYWFNFSISENHRIILELCLILLATYYSQYYSGIFCLSLVSRLTFPFEYSVQNANNIRIVFNPLK